MAFAKPLVIAYGAGNKTLQLINQDSYGSEYYLREATVAYRCKIRHTKEAVLKDGRRYERHNVELTKTIFATSTVPAFDQQAYLIFRHLESDSVLDAAEIGASLTLLINEAAFGDLGGWLS